MIQLKDIPKDYTFCLSASACPHHATCLRALAARALTESGDTKQMVVYTVNPNVASTAGEDCRYYRDNTPVRYAKGMTHIFDEVPVRAEKTVRRKVMACFSCRNYYFLSRKGERLIRPEEQQAIDRVFQAHVPTLKPKYDEYIEDVYW